MHAAALADVLEQPGTEDWTGVTFHAQESLEWMDLWLACTMHNAVSRMPVQQSAIDSGLIKPQFRWGCMAVTEEDNLAYLTLRPTDRGADDRRRYEVGVIGHGRGGEHLARQVVQQIRTWDKKYRAASVDFHLLPGQAGAPITASPGRFALDTHPHRLIVSWR